MNISKYATFEEALNQPDGLCVLGVFFEVNKCFIKLMLNPKKNTKTYKIKIKKHDEILGS